MHLSFCLLISYHDTRMKKMRQMMVFSNKTQRRLKAHLSDDNIYVTERIASNIYPYLNVLILLLTTWFEKAFQYIVSLFLESF